MDELSEDPMDLLASPCPESAADFGRQLRAARHGEREALGRLLEHCRDYLRLVGEEALGRDLQAKVAASDLVQQTFLQAQRDFPRFRGQSEAELAAWLRRMLLNNLADCARSFREAEKRQVGREVSFEALGRGPEPTPLPADSATPSRRAMAGEEEALLLQALGRLPEDYRRAVVLRHQEGLGFEEIGRRLGRSAEAARKLWGRAILLLQKELARP